MATILRQRRDTAANWSSANPVIPDGQLCFDITNNTFRVGDGTTNYSSLSVQSGLPGDMSGANNLSEIVTPATARTNLGLGTAATSASTAFEVADTDISKTDVAESRTANINLHTYTEKYVTISTNGIIDLSLGSVFIHTHGGSMSTFTLSNVPSSGVSGFVLILVNGGAYALNWPASFKWAAATPPVLTAAGTDIFTFTTNDFGTTWFGIASGIGMG